MGTWHAGRERCTCWRSPAPTTGRDWTCLFPQHGPGRKHHRKIELAQWQEVIVRRYPGEFARGLFHSDGWRGVNRVRRRLADGDHWYEYPRYMFGNESGVIPGAIRSRWPGARLRHRRTDRYGCRVHVVPATWMRHPYRIRGAGAGGGAESPVTGMPQERRSTEGRSQARSAGP